MHADFAAILICGEKKTRGRVTTLAVQDRHIKTKDSHFVSDVLLEGEHIDPEICFFVVPGTKEMVILLLMNTGNPGVVHFYDEFAQCLAAQDKRSLVVTVGHANHTSSSIITSQQYDLSDQLRHKQAALAHFM